MARIRQNSALKTILLALIPYSRQNMLLSFSPNRFFNELERQSNYSQRTLKQAYARGQRAGLIQKDSGRLTNLGQREIRPFMATRLKGNARLMVIFDIPETDARARQHLRLTIKAWGFMQVQKSVWISDMDYREALINIIVDLELAGCVEIYEAVRLFPS